MILCKIDLLVFIQLKIDDSKNLLFLHKRNAPKIIVKFSIFSKNHVNNGNEVLNSSWNPSIPKSASVWTVSVSWMRKLYADQCIQNCWEMCISHTTWPEHGLMLPKWKSFDLYVPDLISLHQINILMLLQALFSLFVRPILILKIN